MRTLTNFALLVFALSATATGGNTDVQPNIVIVLADDLGLGDPRCYQVDSKTPTPAMDR